MQLWSFHQTLEFIAMPGRQEGKQAHVFEMSSVHEEARVQAYIRTAQYSVSNRPILKYQAADFNYESG